jgi:hypothetical protein
VFFSAFSKITTFRHWPFTALKYTLGLQSLLFIGPDLLSGHCPASQPLLSTCQRWPPHGNQRFVQGRTRLCLRGVLLPEICGYGERSCLLRSFVPTATGSLTLCKHACRGSSNVGVVTALFDPTAGSQGAVWGMPRTVGETFGPGLRRRRR